MPGAILLTTPPKKELNRYKNVERCSTLRSLYNVSLGENDGYPCPSFAPPFQSLSELPLSLKHQKGGQSGLVQKLTALVEIIEFLF